MEDIPEGDFRRMLPRFQPGVFDRNIKLADEVQKVAARKGCSAAQVAIAWVKAQSGKGGMGTIVPIPGATKVERVEENLAEVELSEGELAELQEMLDKIPIEGGRYGGPLAKLCNL